MHTIGTIVIILFINYGNLCYLCCRFILMDLGEVGRRSDGGIFSNCAFGKALDNGTFELPRPSPPPGTTTPQLPYTIVGDAAFPLRNYMLRPYPGRNLSGN